MMIKSGMLRVKGSDELCCDELDLCLWLRQRQLGTSQNRHDRPQDDLEWDPYCLGSVEGQSDAIRPNAANRQSSLTLKRTLNFLKLVDENLTLSEKLRNRCEQKCEYDENFHAEFQKLELFMENSGSIGDSNNEIELATESLQELQEKIIEISKNWKCLVNKHDMLARKKSYIEKDIANKIAVWKISKYVEYLDSVHLYRFPENSESTLKCEHMEVISQKHLEKVQELAEEFFTFNSVLSSATSSDVIEKEPSFQIHSSTLDKLTVVMASVQLFQATLENCLMRKLQQTEDQINQINATQETECQSELKKDFEDSNDMKSMRQEGAEVVSDAQLDEHLSLASSLQQNAARIQKRIKSSPASGGKDETFRSNESLSKGGNKRKNKKHQEPAPSASTNGHEKRRSPSLSSQLTLQISNYPSHILMSLNTVSQNTQEAHQIIQFISSNLSASTICRQRSKNSSWLIQTCCKGSKTLFSYIVLPLVSIILLLYLVNLLIDYKIVCIRLSDLLPC